MLSKDLTTLAGDFEYFVPLGREKGLAGVEDGSMGVMDPMVASR